MSKKLSEGHVVICVDDDPEVLSALKRLLRAEPYHVLLTGRPSKVLEWIRMFDVSLVITDQRMPEQTGVSLLQEVRQRSPSTAQVILTGFPESTAGTPGLSAQIEGLISKPWDGVMLRKAIRQMLRDRESALSWIPRPSAN